MSTVTQENFADMRKEAINRTREMHMRSGQGRMNQNMTGQNRQNVNRYVINREQNITHQSNKVINVQTPPAAQHEPVHPCEDKNEKKTVDSTNSFARSQTNTAQNGHPQNSPGYSRGGGNNQQQPNPAQAVNDMINKAFSLVSADGIKIDRDFLIILLFIIILAKEGADLKLLIALGYILI